MKKEDSFYLGKITKTFGYRGELILLIDADNPEKYLGLELVYINIDNELVPFFFREIEPKTSTTFVVSFEDVTDIDKAKVLCGRSVYLPSELLPKLQGDKFYLHEIIGFLVIDQEMGEIGSVDDVLELPQQLIIRILSGKREILIPLVDEILSSIDKPNKTIRIKAPEGLIDSFT